MECKCEEKDRPAKGGVEDACKEMTGEAESVCVIGDMERIEAGVGMVNLRIKSPSTRVRGICISNLDSTRRSLWGKIIRGVRPAIMI
jgi:hypothetical protein